MKYHNYFFIKSKIYVLKHKIEKTYFILFIYMLYNIKMLYKKII